jgi:hypothetical protein
MEKVHCPTYGYVTLEGTEGKLRLKEEKARVCNSIARLEGWLYDSNTTAVY